MEGTKNVFISSYLRKQSIDDGVLTDVSEHAKEVGFKFPVAITSGVLALINNIPKKYNYQDFNGRLHDVLCMARLAARNSSGQQINFTLTMHHTVIDKDNNRSIRNTVNLKAIIGPGDNMEPVITIMLPFED